jgi:hypothetical protein
VPDRSRYAAHTLSVESRASLPRFDMAEGSFNLAVVEDDGKVDKPQRFPNVSLRPFEPRQQFVVGHIVPTDIDALLDARYGQLDARDAHEDQQHAITRALRVAQQLDLVAGPLVLSREFPYAVSRDGQSFLWVKLNQALESRSTELRVSQIPFDVSR